MKNITFTLEAFDQFNDWVVEWANVDRLTISSGTIATFSSYKIGDRTSPSNLAQLNWQ